MGRKIVNKLINKYSSAPIAKVRENTGDPPEGQNIPREAEAVGTRT